MLVSPGERGNGFRVTWHTAAMTWLAAGLSLARVAAYLGGTKQTVLPVYAHFLPSDDQRAREIMDACFASTRSCAPGTPKETGYDTLPQVTAVRERSS